jgi:hypothetical protein
MLVSFDGPSTFSMWGTFETKYASGDVMKGKTKATRAK